MNASSFGLFAVLTLGQVGRVEAKPRPADDIGIDATVTVAQARFRRALELYQEGNLDAARAELHRAYDASPNYRVLYNLGQVEFELHDYPAALATLRKYLLDGGERVNPARRAQVVADIEKLESRVAVVDIRATTPHVDIAIDDVPIGVTPLPTVTVIAAGRRKIVASRIGYVTETRWLEVGGGDRPTVDFDLREFVLAPRPEVARGDLAGLDRRVQPTPRRASEGPPVPWIGWAITGTLAAGAAATGALTLRAARDLQQERATFGAERAELDERKRRVDQMALATDVLIGTAVLGGALSLYFTLAHGPKAESSVPRVSLGLHSIAVSSTF